LRILQVDMGREMRGGQRQVLLLLNGLRDVGEECVLLARPGSPLFKCAAEARFVVYPATLKNLWTHSKQAALLHAQDARSHTYAALVSRAPFVVSRRVAFPLKQSMVSRWKYRQASRFLAVSWFVAAQLEDAAIAKNKIDVVYDGVDPGGKAAEWRPDYPVVALDSDDPAKGRDLVENATRLAGMPVHFSNDLNRDLERASMFVYVTRAEGFGSAALLAMARGIPVIASNVGGLSEALDFGEAGLLTRNDPHEIAAAMRRLREDSTLARTLIERGKNRVAEHFTAARMVERTIESYRRALAR
jgi:glycosyltransferase involved in cell wall biosynthesis